MTDLGVPKVPDLPEMVAALSARHNALEARVAALEAGAVVSATDVGRLRAKLERIRRKARRS